MPIKNSFSERCYALLKTVPKGKVTTYQSLAHALGTQAYRAVGTALHHNPYAPNVPCHRVVNANGDLGGFASGPKKKIALLRQEGVLVKGGKIVDFEKKFFNCKPFK